MKPIAIGSIALAEPVFLAPMTGVTDLPFRSIAHDLGAPIVVSEMVASRELATARADVVRKATNRDISPFVMQLVGSEACWMSEGARIAEDLGAAIIDINMGCPAREVTGKQSGSALMRDLDHALQLIEAVLSSVSVPVTLKMRLGWDDRTHNAPELAWRAEQAGIALITVHARTRCQFFKGKAQWAAVRPVKDAVRVPVIVNGDITGPSSARRALELSGADGVMIGRGAYGAPWMPARIAKTLLTGHDPGVPTPEAQAAIALRHYDAMLSYYGPALGVRNARKHIGWYLTHGELDNALIKYWRSQLCQEDDPVRVRRGLSEAFGTVFENAA